MECSPEVMVLQALKAATDQSVEVVKKAEHRLAEWEQQAGFFPTLLRIMQNQQFEVNVRWMAAVYLKSGVHRFWRKGIKNELPAADKSEIRRNLLQSFSEPVPQITLQIADLIAKIARYDYPKEWPDLVPVLLKNIQTTDDMQQQRVLRIFHQVIKALVSKRMMSEKKEFEELTSNIYDYMYDLWDGFTNMFFQSLDNNRSDSYVHLEKALLALKTLRKLSVYGHSKPQSSVRCLQFLQVIFGRLKQCLELRYQLQHVNAGENVIQLMEKFILKQVKTLNEILEYHPAAFVKFISTALEFSFHYVFHEGTILIFDDGNVINFPQFTIHCLNLMKGILLCNLYYDNKLKDTLPPEDKPVPLTDFFTSERICYICEKIITHYFLLTQVELDLWIADAESFSQDDNGGDSWKYSLRPSVERLFLTVMNKFRSEMTTEVLKYITKAQQIHLTRDSKLGEILLKDAIYYAAGLASFNLFDEIDFDAWFANQLLAEIKIDSDNFRILRRRAIWLTAQWSAVKFSRDLRPLSYEACLHLLRPSEDLFVRLESSKSLKALINSFEFEPESFQPYLERIFSALFVLLAESKEHETKMNVLHIISEIIEKMNDQIRSQADNLIAYLPILWKDNEDHNLLKCSIIYTLQQTIKALHEVPEQMKPFLYAVIKLSTDIAEPSHIYLMEEGLSLWLCVIENSTAATPELLNICKNMVPIIEMSSENLRTILYITQAYVLLCPNQFLKCYGNQIVELCLCLLTDMQPEGTIVIMKVFETIMKVDSTIGLEVLRPAFPYIFRQIYDNTDYPMVMSTYLAVAARVLISNQNEFFEILNKLNVNNALGRVVDVWCSKLPLASELDKRKLLCLGLASILTVNNPVISERFPAIMQNISEVLKDLMKEEATKDNEARKYYDALVLQDENDLSLMGSDYCGWRDDCDYQAHNYDRYRQLSLKDPVHAVALKDCVEWHLNTLRSQLGDMGYQYLMNTVYSGVLSNLSDYLDLSVIPKAAAK